MSVCRKHWAMAAKNDLQNKKPRAINVRCSYLPSSPVTKKCLGPNFPWFSHSPFCHSIHPCRHSILLQSPHWTGYGQSQSACGQPWTKSIKTCHLNFSLPSPSRHRLIKAPFFWTGALSIGDGVMGSYFDGPWLSIYYWGGRHYSAKSKKWGQWF